jgi:hypothetical protein
MQRNGQKRDKKKSMGKDDRKKASFPQLFRPKAFDMDSPQKVFMVFLNSPSRGAKVFFLETDVYLADG